MKKYCALILVILLLPSLGLLLGGSEPSSENRQLAKVPSLRTEEGALNTEILSEAGAYFEDHFAFRNEWVTGYAILLRGLFGVSAQESVICGKEGWLYYKDSLKDFQGAEQLTGRQLFDIAHTLRMVQDGLREDAVRFVFAVAPNKNSLYGEHMPYYYSGYREDTNNYARLQPFLEAEEVHVADVRSALEEMDEVLYHLRDSHWDNRGAAIAADVILGELGVDHPMYDGMKITEHRDFVGDLDKMLFPAAPTPELEYSFEREPQFTYLEEVESNFDPKIYTESEAEEGSLLMYRDSFGNALLPFMAECFAESYFSRGVPYQLTDDVYENDVDTVVIERAERFLPDMARNAPMMLAPIIPAASLEEAVFSPEVGEIQEAERDIYTIVRGILPEGRAEAEERIYIRVDGELTYEAFPVTDEQGREGFQLMLVTELLESQPQYELYIAS